MTAAPLRFHFITPVWGENHVSLFLEIGLPSLLAPGNLLGLFLLDRAVMEFLIYTRPEDDPRIAASPIVQRLMGMMPVQIRHIERPITVPHHTMTDCHIDGLREAEREDAAAVFIPPDCVWADGSMRAMEKIARTGVSMIHMSGIRLHRDAAVPLLRARLSDDRRALTIAARPLAALGLACLHKIAYSHFYDEHLDRERGVMPANLYWSAPNGLALRCFHLHPLMVKPQVKGAPFTSTIDDDLADAACPDPSGDYVVTDSDEILAFEISPPDRIVGAPFRKGSAESTAAWAEYGANGRHRRLVRHPIRIHSGPVDEVAWRRVEAESGRVIDAVGAINAMSTLRLALAHPSVVPWRIFAVTLRGARTPGPHQARWRALNYGFMWGWGNAKALYGRARRAYFQARHLGGQALRAAGLRRTAPR